MKKIYSIIMSLIFLAGVTCSDIGKTGNPAIPLTDAEAVATDIAALEVIYGSGDSATNVTQNVTLPTTGSSGTTITWATTNSGAVTIGGAVTRPLYTGTDDSVTLTATISKGLSNDIKTFILTVKKNAQTDAEAVADDKAALAIIYGSGDSAGNVTQNVTLPTTGSSGTTITWATTNSGAVTTGGVVTRPAFAAGNASVTLTATITKNAANDTKPFNLTVIKNAATDAEAVADDKAALAIIYGSGDSAGNVTQNLTLPTTGSSGATITWATTNSGVVTTGGIVTRPAFAAGNAAVTLTATITKNAASDTKPFNLTVIKNAQTDAEAVADDKAALAITYGSGDSAGNVTQNVTLPTTGSSGTTITWATTNSGAVTIGGVVTRPAFAAGNASVTLTATITKNATNDTRPFNLTVIKLPAGTFSITFDKNGGTGTNMADQSITEGASANLTANTYTRATYVFSGWATTPTGGVAFNDKQSYTMGSSNVTLYAVWTLSASLLINYNFDGQNCNDSSGNGNNGTASNITYVSDGSSGYSASLNGTTSYIALPNSTVLNSAAAFTIMMRFKTTSGGCLFGYQNNSVGSVPTQFVPIITVRSDGKLRGELWMGSQLEVISAAAVNDGNWHTVYFSAKASSIALYLDGAQVAAPAVGTVQHLSMTINQIGTADGAVRPYMPNSNGNLNFWYYFNGLIDDFYFYSSALH